MTSYMDGYDDALMRCSELYDKLASKQLRQYIRVQIQLHNLKHLQTQDINLNSAITQTTEKPPEKESLTFRLTLN